MTNASLLLSAVGMFAFVAPAVAAEAAGLWITKSDNGSEIQFSGINPAESPEGMEFSLSCQSADGRGPQVTIVGDERTVPMLRALASTTPYDKKPAALFQFSGNIVPAEVVAYDAGFEDMNGTWDVTLTFADPDADLARKIAAGATAGPLKLTVVGTTFDMTPRSADRKILVGFLRACGGS
ncbi:MAG: hypothetical protein ACTHOR_18435 [Devosia sp.]